MRKNFSKRVIFYFTVMACPIPSLAQDAPSNTSAIAQDTQRDLQADGYYNKPGALRTDYDRDWQQCRLIARGSPGIGSAGFGVLGSILDSALTEGRERRANRKTCMLFKGWRFVNPTDVDQQKLMAMPESVRNIQLNLLIGATDTQYKSITLLPKADSYPFSVDFVNRIVTPGNPPVPAMDPAQMQTHSADQGVVLIGIRRPDNFSLGRSAMLQFDRYDIKKGDLMSVPPKTALADGVIYAFTLNSHNKQAALEYYAFRVTAGDYVLTSIGIGSATTTPGAFCFAAPLLHIVAGQVVYVGDFVPVWDARTSNGGRVYALGYSNHLDDANLFAKALPNVPTGGVAQADIKNGATFPCHAQSMSGYIIPDKPYLPASN